MNNGFNALNRDTRTIYSDIPSRKAIVVRQYTGKQMLKFTNRTIDGMYAQIQTIDEKTGHYYNGEKCYIHFHWDGTVYSENSEFNELLTKYGLNCVNEKRAKTAQEMREYFNARNNKD